MNILNGNKLYTKQIHVAVSDRYVLYGKGVLHCKDCSRSKDSNSFEPLINKINSRKNLFYMVSI